MNAIIRLHCAPEDILFVRAHGGRNGFHHKAIERHGALVTHHDHVPLHIEPTPEAVATWINAERGL
jgi:hypothetical protein